MYVERERGSRHHASKEDKEEGRVPHLSGPFYLYIRSLLPL